MYKSSVRGFCSTRVGRVGEAERGCQKMTMAGARLETPGISDATTAIVSATARCSSQFTIFTSIFGTLFIRLPELFHPLSYTHEVPRCNNLRVFQNTKHREEKIITCSYTQNDVNFNP